MATRKIIEIDEEKCDGCGECVPQCAEGALQIVGGKARLASESYCDGLGACIGHCPQGAIRIIEREAAEFDEQAVEERMRQSAQHTEAHKAGSCPGAAVLEFSPESLAELGGAQRPSALSQWPLQLHLVPVQAPYLKGADLLLAADCVPFAMANFHGELLKGRKVLVACPKLDDTAPYEEKLAAMLRENDIRSLTVAHMEVPCCYGLVALAKSAIERSGRDVPLHEVTVTVRGQVRSEADQGHGGSPCAESFSRQGDHPGL